MIKPVSLLYVILLALLTVHAANVGDMLLPACQLIGGEENDTFNYKKANMHLCPEGKWAIGEDAWGRIVRVNMLKITDADWKNVPGVKKAWRMKGFEGVEGMAFHPIISEVKDVDGDGKPDIFRCRGEHAGARIERLRYDDGSVVWESEPMGALHGDESRLPVFDLHGTGCFSVLHATKDGTWCVHADTGETEWFATDGDGNIEVIYDHEGCGAAKGPIHVVDGLTGKIKIKIDYRNQGVSHAQNMAVGNFDPTREGLEIAFCEKMGNLFLFDSTGTLLWKRPVPTSLLSKGDWNGGGAEEIFVFSPGANVDGMFSVWNGKGERLYAISFLPSPYNDFQPPPQSRNENEHYKKHDGGTWRAHAMPGGHEGIRRQVDLDGNGRADVIMPFGEWHWGSDSILFLMEGPTPSMKKRK